MAPSKGQGTVEEDVSDSQGNGDYVDRYWSPHGGSIEWDSRSLNGEQDYPRIRWSQQPNKGKGKNLYLEGLKAAKDRGHKGLLQDRTEEQGGGPTKEAIGVADSLKSRGLIDITLDEIGNRQLSITAKGEDFLKGGK